MDFERVWPGGIDDEIERRLAEAGRLAPWSNAVEVNAGPLLMVALAVDRAMTARVRSSRA